MNTTFADLGLSETLLAAVEELGYSEPTPVQEQAIPLALSGSDVVATAQTGTGKTAAFGLPILQTVKARRKQTAPAALVVTPTRELAEQIEHFFTTVAKSTRHRILTVVGGLSYSRQLRRLREGVDILVATPGRLLDLMDRGAVDLDHLSMLVLDEADRMLDMGFWPDVEKIVKASPSDRQTMLFSATIDRKIAESIGDVLKEPAYVEIAHRGETADLVEQHVIHIPHRKKPELLRLVLSRRGCLRTIVFVRTRGACDEVAADLCKSGFRAQAIHSSLSQAQRRRALERFKQNRIGVLVATDVLARGIDVSDVEHIINYDLPDTPDDYVHRIGRTGRAGKEGDALSFVSPKGRNNLRSIERLTKQHIPVMDIEDLLELDVLPEPTYNDEPESREGDRRRGSSRPAKNGTSSRRNPKADKADGKSRRKSKRPLGEKPGHEYDRPHGSSRHHDGHRGKKALHPAERRIRKKELRELRERSGEAGRQNGSSKKQSAPHRPDGVAAFGEAMLKKRRN